MKISVRSIVFGIIIVICVAALIFGIYWQFFKTSSSNNSSNNNTQNINLEHLASEFTNIFENRLEYQGNTVNISGITKINSNEDLIYTWVTKETSNDSYILNLNIPRVNISSTSAQNFNNKIKDIYVNKANEIITNRKNNPNFTNTVYTVEYMGYINSNILSLVIKSTLKEGNNPQRIIIGTYNYNLSTNEEISFNQILEIKNLEEDSVKNAIIQKVQKSNIEAESLKNLGYNVYMRDINSSIYEIKNTTNFILGADNNLYVIYPYGNANYTDEMDIIVF